MNVTYIVINRKVRATSEGFIKTFGKLSFLIDQEIEDEETKQSIKATFSKNGLNRSEYISDRYIIRKMEIERKAKVC